MTKGPSTSQLVFNSEDLREMIGWQQARYQHIQSLSLGLLASSLTILAVSASVYTAFGKPIPVYSSPVSAHGPPFVGLISTRIIIGFGFLISLTGFALVIGMYLQSMWKFLELVFEKPLNIDLKDRAGEFSSPRLSEPRTRLDSPARVYRTTVKSNWKSLKIQRRQFRFAAIRFLFSILFTIGAYQVYIFSVNRRLIQIVVIAAVPVALAFVKPIKKRFRPINHENDIKDTQEITLWEELLHDYRGERSRWADAEIQIWELSLIGLIVVSSCIITLSFIFAWFI